MTDRSTLNGIKAAVFDLDGTLFDSVGLWHRIDDEFLGKRGFVPTDEYKHGISALGNREVALFTIKFFGLKDTPEQLMDEWAGMARKAYAHSIPLLPHAKEYLDECKCAGLKLAVVTSLADELAEAGLKNNGIYDMFDEIVTADNCGLSKSAAEIYLHTARNIGVQPDECVAFDDVLPALVSAKAAGMITVAIEGKMLSRQKAAGFVDYVIPDFSHAPKLIRN
ncbi:MAG: HAD family phosphatase [Clostridiales bacterium]|nr:HAD family phosphatase [Clostridiales bacterium]